MTDRNNRASSRNQASKPQDAQGQTPEPKPQDAGAVSQGAGSVPSQGQTQGTDAGAGSVATPTPDYSTGALALVVSVTHRPRYVTHRGEWVRNQVQTLTLAGASVGGLAGSMLSRDAVDADSDQDAPQDVRPLSTQIQDGRVCAFVPVSPDALGFVLRASGFTVKGAGSDGPDQRPLLADLRALLGALKSAHGDAVKGACETIMRALTSPKIRTDALAILDRAGKGDKTGRVSALVALAGSVWNAPSPEPQVAPDAQTQGAGVLAGAGA